MNGEFVNMKYQAVYRFFDREKHLAKTKLQLDPSRPVVLCFDFNVDYYCVSICQDHRNWQVEKNKI